MKLSDIAIKVTNRNRMALIVWLEDICVRGTKPSDYLGEAIHVYDKELYLEFSSENVDSWSSRPESDKELATLTEAKKIYNKYNRPQPTHAELKSERGRSSMYKLKYEEAKKYCHKLYAMLDAGSREAIRREKELVAKNSKLINEVEEYKLLISEEFIKELEEQANKHVRFKRIAMTTIVILTSIILYGLA